MPTARFSTAKRLSGRRTFERLFRTGKVLRGEWMNLQFLPREKERTRFGCSVRRSIFPHAVDRNRMKRWLRESFRLHQEELPKGLDLMARVVSKPREASYRTVEEEFLRLVKCITY